MKKQNKNIILAISSKCISQVGDIMFDFANNSFLAGLGAKSISLVGIYQASESIVGILFNMFGGVIADNFRRKKIIVLGNLLSGIACILSSLITQNNILIYAIILVNIFLAVMNSFSSPAYKAYTKEIVEINKITQLNSYLETGSTIIKVLFPIISVVFYKLLGIQGALILDGLSFLLASLLLSFTKERNIEENDRNKDLKFKNIFLDLVDGIKYLMNHKKIFLLIILSALVNFFLGAYNLLLPYSNKMFPIFSVDLYAIFLSSIAIGGIIGSIFSNLINKKLSIYTLTLYLGLSGLLLTLTPFIYYLFKNYFALAFMLMMFNLFLTIFNIQFFSLIQKEVSNKYLGRVFGIIFTIAVLFMPIGTTVFSIILNTKASLNFAFIGIAIIILAISFMVLLKLNYQKSKQIKEVA